METKEPDSRLSVRKEDLEDQELYNLNKIINDLYSKITTARDETDDAVKKFTRSGVISSVSDQSTASLPPPIEGGIPQPQASDWTLNSVVYSAGEDGLQYGFASAAINSKPVVVDYYSMFIQDYSSGYVNTLGTTVTLTAASKEAGNTFENCVKDQVININSVAYTLAADAVAPFESVTITSSAGTQTNVYFNLNPVDGKWEEIASNAEAGTWQLRPPTGWDVPCCLTASTKDQKTFEPPTGVNYKRLQFTAWGNAPQVTSFLVEIENQPPATTDIPSAKFVVNFTKPLDPEYYYASIERLQFETSSFTGVIGPTAVVTASGTTITYSSSSSLYTTFKFKGQYFTHLQAGDTVYVGNASSVTTSNSFTVAEVISNTQIRLQSAPNIAGDLLFAQWGRMAGEINPFSQTDYWPLPTTAEYWTFRSRSVNHREVANDTSPPTVNVTVPASGGITPLTPATPLGPSDWALNPLQTSTDEAGNSYVFISATITTPSPNADYYSLFWQKTTAPTSGDWIEIAADATAGTWQPWPAEGADYAVAIAANKNTYKLQQPQNPIINATDLTSAQNGQVYVITTSGSTDFTLIGATSSAVGTVFTKSGGTGSGSGAVSKAVSIPAWGDANQVTNFSVSIETDNKAGVESGRFVVNFDPPVDLDYYYTSIERLLYDVTTSPPWPAGSNIGATAIVDVNSSTRVITYTTSGWPSGFVGQKFAYIQDGDTVYLGTASTLTDSNAYTVEEVISSTQLKLTTVPAGSPTGVLFAQWGRIAGEVNPFTQVDYWPLPGGNGERWKFRARSVNYRRRANNVSPPTFDVVVSASSGVNLVDMVKTTSSPTWSVEGGTVVIKSTNTNAPIEVNNTNALVLSTGYVGPNQIGVRNTTSGNFYPYATLDRSTGSGWASLNTYGGPLLTTTDSWASIYASTIPTNSYALFRNMPIQVGDSTAAGGTTVIDEYRRGFFTDLNANVFRLGTTATAGYVLTTDASGIGTWQAAGAAGAAGSTGYVQFNNSGVLAADANFFWDNTNKRLGIGTSSPAFLLDAAGSCRFGNVVGISGGDTTPTQIGVLTFGQSTTSTYAWIQSWSSRPLAINPSGNNVGIGTSSPGEKLVVVGNIVAGNTGTTADGYIDIDGGATGKVRISRTGTGATASGMVFYTQYSALQERMRILSTGEVGIGTSSPGGKLDVASVPDNTIGLKVTATSGYFDVWPYYNFGGDYRGVWLRSLNPTGTAYQPFSISGSVMSLTGGNVGIGTLSPDALLTVNTIASFGDGAEATPSIAHKGDLNTGFWFPAVDTVAVSTDGAERWRVTSAGFLIPADSDTYDIGVLSTNRVRAVYAKFIETSQAGGVGDYVKSRLFRFVDTAGGAGYWDTFANASVIGSSNFSIKDNSGSRLMVGWRASLGSPVNYTYWYSDLIPALRSIAGGDAVNDSFYPSLGSATYPWGTTYTSQIYVYGTVNSDLVPFGTNTYDLGDSTYRWASLWSVGLNISGAMTANGSTGSSGQLLSTTGSLAQWVNISSQLTAGTGVTITGTTNATIAIGQAVGTTSNVTFNSLTVSSSGIGITSYGTVFSIASTNLYIDNSIGNDIYIRPASGRYVLAGGTALIPNGSTTLGNATYPWPSVYADYIYPGVSLRPETNNTVTCGDSTNAWSAVYSYAYYAHNGTSWSAGWTGTFSIGSQTVTVQDGIITNVA